MLEYDKIINYDIKAVCVTPLHVGNAGGDKGRILIDEISGTPFIQGSSIAGVFRESCSEEEASDWFGNPAREKPDQSRISFSDGSIDNDGFKLEMRTRVSIDPKTGSVKSEKTRENDISSGQLFDIEMVSAETEFSFTITAFAEGGSKASEGKNLIRKLLSRVENGEIRFGGQGSNGFGRAKLKTVFETTYDLCLETKSNEVFGRKEWAKGEKSSVNISKEIESEAKAIDDYRICFTFGLPNALLIKGNFVNAAILSENLKKDLEEKDVPDSMNIADGNGKFIIPGSSVKGVLRSRVKMIADKLGLSADITEKSFGSKEVRSRIRVEDTIIDKPEALLSRRTRINKWTGSVMNRALFSEAVVGGNATVELSVQSGADGGKWTDADARRLSGLIIYAIRDLGLGLSGLGSTNSVGRGIIDLDSITLKVPGGREETIKREDKLSDGSIIRECLRAVKEGH